ncbi:MAG: cytochrome C, partial [Planctomycetota bacterium]|nr:cytochrome C [Planctomycetota bacterium]
MAVNGEGRVSPVMPGCQVSATVIGADGETILKNHIFRTLPDSEGSGAEGQLGIDMSPVQPHTVGEARPCHSCHLSEKAAGYGIAGGRLNREPNEPVIVDLMTADAQILPASVQTQIEAIPGLMADWSRFVTEQGKQLQTVGSHFSLSRPLNNQERQHMDRQGVCQACHKEIPDESLATGFLHHIASHTGQLPKTPEQHNSLVHNILMITAWGQLLGVAGGASAALLCCVLWLR